MSGSKYTPDSEAENNAKPEVVSEYFPEGYYWRFLNDNCLEDTPSAKEFFKNVCNISAYYGEEATEELGNILAKWELDSYDSLLVLLGGSLSTPEPRLQRRK